MLYVFQSRGGSTALLAFLVKSEQEKKKKSKSELASFEKLSSNTSAKVTPTAFTSMTTITFDDHSPHHQCHAAPQLRSILEKANSSLSNDREKRAKEQKGNQSVALPARAPFTELFTALVKRLQAHQARVRGIHDMLICQYVVGKHICLPTATTEEFVSSSKIAMKKLHVMHYKIRSTTP
jgi:hypothetical protein